MTKSYFVALCFYFSLFIFGDTFVCKCDYDLLKLMTNKNVFVFIACSKNTHLKCTCIHLSLQQQWPTTDKFCHLHKVWNTSNDSPACDFDVMWQKLLAVVFYIKYMFWTCLDNWYRCVSLFLDIYSHDSNKHIELILSQLKPAWCNNQTYLQHIHKRITVEHSSSQNCLI